MARRAGTIVRAMNVLVVGMHRSGTSAIAQALQAAGLFGWNEGDQLESAPQNPLGFGERRLTELGWTWDAPAAVPASDPPTLQKLVAEGRRLIERELDSHGPWLVKD